ncbi:MAG: helix-turn-helix domain-containing protein [Mycobacterium sp.]
MKLGLREARRKAIVKAAYEVITERGYDNTAMSDVTHRAGVAQGTLYRYVRSKRELVDHVFDYAVGRAVRAFDVRKIAEVNPAGYGDSIQLARLFGERLFALVDDDPGVVRMIIVEASAIDPELRYRVMGLVSTMHARLAEVFQQAYPDKRADGDRRTWDLLGRMVMGLAAPGLLMSMDRPASRDLRAQYLDTVTDIAERGLMVGGAPGAQGSGS